MNRYLIECINDCKNEFVVAYAPSMYDDNMSKATDGYVSLPPYLDSYEYFERYSKVNYMDYTVPENFEEGQNLCCPLFPGITYEEAIDQLYGFVKKNRIIGCVYDW